MPDTPTNKVAFRLSRFDRLRKALVAIPKHEVDEQKAIDDREKAKRRELRRVAFVNW
jgi:hypothetical protein